MNVAQVEIRAEYFGERVENTFFYEFASAITQPDLQDLVDAIAPVVVSDWLPQLPPNWLGSSVYAKDLTTQFATQAVNLDILAAPGTLAEAGLPGNVTLAIKRTAGLTGRSTRGRIYWMALTEPRVTGNQVAAGVALDYIECVEAVDDAAIALTWTPVIVSRQQNGVVLPAGVTYPITAWGVDDFNVDSQRRRLAGRGG